jgi:hypothetical protein
LTGGPIGRTLFEIAMRASIPVAVVALFALVALLTPAVAAAAPASDAQVRIAVVHELTVVGHQKGAALAKSLHGVRVSLAAAVPTTPAAKTAKALALQGAAKASLAAAEQIQAEKDSTLMRFDPAAAQTALANAHLAAASKLLNRAASLLGLKQRLH